MEITLGLATKNNKYKIKKITGGVHFKKRLKEMGIEQGQEIEIIKSGPGPVIVKSSKSKIALGFGEAMKIIVEDNEE